MRSLSSGNVIFTNEMRLVGENDQFFKGERQKKSKTKEVTRNQRDRLWLNLKNDKGGFNQLLIGFLEEAGPDFDYGYDARRFEGGNPISFYSKVGEEKLVIQARESFKRSLSIPLGFRTRVAPRTFSIEIANSEGVLESEQILLRDLKLNILHDLSTGPYEFYVETSGEQSERFLIEFEEESVLNVSEYEKEKDWVAFAKNNLCFVRAPERIIQIRVYNVLGALIHESFPYSSQFEIPLKGVKHGEILLIDVFDESGGRQSKKIYSSSPHL
jgi:hypothetical protein